MIYVTHDGNDRWTLFKLLVLDRIIRCHIVKLIKRVHRRHFHFELFGKDLDLIFTQEVVLRYHHPQCEEYFDHITGCLTDLLGKLVDPDVLRDLYGSDDTGILLFGVLLALTATFERASLLRTERLSAFGRTSCRQLTFLGLLLALLLLTHHLFVDVLVGEVEQHNLLFAKSTVDIAAHAVMVEDIDLLSCLFRLSRALFHLLL